MFFTNVKESGLESLLVNWLVNHNGAITTRNTPLIPRACSAS